jgi:2-polyprenyl-3-methyl-5-hydroxy-6-metoxy-1,4-benzoquinol methylase
MELSKKTMTNNILDEISKQALTRYIEHCAQYTLFDKKRMYELTIDTIKMHRKENVLFEQVKEIKQLENKWYESLKSGVPDYSVYDSPYYFVDIWLCWVNYSRKYLKEIQSPKSMGNRSIVQDMGNVETVIDLGCGFGYTCAAWKSIFPNAKIFGTNLSDTAQFKMASDLAKLYNFTIVNDANGIKADVIFASEYFEHILDPIAHLDNIIKQCRPHTLLIASTFNSPAIGHFKQYEYKGIKYDGRKMSRMFNEALRYYGYEKIKTKCWNGRPAYWKRIK